MANPRQIQIQNRILERTDMLRKVVGWTLTVAMLVLATASVIVEPEETDLVANSHPSAY